MAIDKTIYIHITDNKTGYRVQSNQNLNKFDRFSVIESTPNESYLIADKIREAIIYLHVDSPRKSSLFEISGNKEVVAMLTDKEYVKALKPTQYRWKQVATRLEAMLSIKDLILVAK